MRTLILAAVACLAAWSGWSAEVASASFEAYVPCQQITPATPSHWFGYYDKFETDPSDRYVLAMEVTFDSRSPQATDVIGLGMVDLQNRNQWKRLAETRAWGWQQGCMLQWIPGSTSEIIYNDRQGDRFVAIVLDVFTGKKRVLPRAVYTLSPDGVRALSLNFARIDDTRPGYGYEGGVDPGAENLHPADDGIYLMDVKTGDSRLVVSIDQIANTGRVVSPTEGKHWFNHLLFNTDGTRFEFLHRWYRRYPKAGGWATRMFTSDLSGKDVHCVDPYGYTSHFIWRDPTHILCWTRTPKFGDAYHLFTDKSDQVEIMGKGVLNENGHMTYSPDRRWVLTDTYPDKDRMQNPMLYRPSDGKLVHLGRFYAPTWANGEWRCDTHPRWSRDGKRVFIDSAHNGRRQVYMLDVSKIVAGG